MQLTAIVSDVSELYASFPVAFFGLLWGLFGFFGLLWGFFGASLAYWLTVVTVVTVVTVAGCRLTSVTFSCFLSQGQKTTTR